jgi:hypothetical protein
MSTFKTIRSLNVVHRVLAMIMVSLLHRWQVPNKYGTEFVFTQAFQIIDVTKQRNRPDIISFFSTIKLYGRQRNTRDDTDDGVENYSMIKSTTSNVKGNNKTMKKENLPTKICVVCNRPFTWRKKWERCWDEVTTCSKKCNGERRTRK